MEAFSFIARMMFSITNVAILAYLLSLEFYPLLTISYSSGKYMKKPSLSALLQSYDLGEDFFLMELAESYIFLFDIILTD
jgi:hypothetical protein